MSDWIEMGAPVPEYLFDKLEQGYDVQTRYDDLSDWCDVVVVGGMLYYKNIELIGHARHREWRIRKPEPAWYTPEHEPRMATILAKIDDGYEVQTSVNGVPWERVNKIRLRDATFFEYPDGESVHASPDRKWRWRKT